MSGKRLVSKRFWGVCTTSFSMGSVHDFNDLHRIGGVIKISFKTDFSIVLGNPANIYLGVKPLSFFH
jgi:hypothetical protein